MEIVLYSSDQSLSNTSSQSSHCNQWPLGMLLVRCYFSESSIIQYIIFNDPAWNEAYTCNPRQEEKRGHVRLCTLVSPTSGVEIVPATLSFLLMMALWFHQQRLTDQHYQHYTEKRTKSIPCFVSGLLSAPGALLLLTMCKFHKLHFTTSCFLAALARKGKTTPKKLLQYNREGPSSSLWFTCSKLSINSALPFSWWTVQCRTGCTSTVKIENICLMFTIQTSLLGFLMNFKTWASWRLKWHKEQWRRLEDITST